MVPCQSLIIVVNGSINSGCKAVKRELFRRIPETNWAEIDPLGQLDECYPLGMDACLQEAVEAAENAALMRRSLIMVWRFDDLALETFRTRTAHLGMPVVAFVLSPPLKVALSCRYRHEPTAKERCLIWAFYRQGRHRPSIGTIIDNSSQTTKQTAITIIERLHQQGLVF